MEVELMEKEGTKMKVKIIGEGHTFCNALRKKLHEDERVLTAAYNIEHPLLSDPVMHLEVAKRKSPKSALVRAAGSLEEEYKEVQAKLEKALG